MGPGSTCRHKNKHNMKFISAFFAADPRCYKNCTSFDDTNVSPITWDGKFYIPLVDKFKYIGSQLCRTCTYTLDVSSRIESAAKAFGALRKRLFMSNNVSATARRGVYVAIILSILLYGCE